MSANSSVIKQIIRYTVTTSGDYTKSGLSIDPNKTIVLINGSGYSTSKTTQAGDTSSGYRGYGFGYGWNNDPYLKSVTSTTVVTTITGGMTINYSVQVIEFY